MLGHRGLMWANEVRFVANAIRDTLGLPALITRCRRAKGRLTVVPPPLSPQ